MNRRPPRILSVTLLTAALVLTGCGSGDQPSAGSGPNGGATAGSTPTGTAEATETGVTELPGGMVTGRSGTFSVTAPAGWGVATDQAGAVAGLDLVLLSSKKTAKFSNNLVIIASDGDAATVDDELAKGRAQMGGAGREVSDADDLQIGGVTAKGFTTKFEQQGVKVTARSFGLHRNGKVYLLTLSSSQDDAAGALAELKQIAGSWTWK